MKKDNKKAKVGIFTTLIERIKKPTWLFPRSQTEDVSDIFKQLIPEQFQLVADKQPASDYSPIFHLIPPSGTHSVVAYFSPASGIPDTERFFWSKDLILSRSDHE